MPSSSSSAKRVLGRGLADLIPVGGDAAAAAGANPSDEPAAEVALTALHPNPRQPRTHFDDAALSELADSIRTNGLLQPILVRPRPTGGFEIVAGERRYRAAARAGLGRVPVVIRSLTDAEALALALVENLIREDIGPMETARALRRLMDDFGWTQEEAARRVGKSRSAVANVLRLLDLPLDLQESVERGEITEGHARALLMGKDRQRQRRVWQMIRDRGLSVREAERLMKNEPAASTNAAALRAGAAHARPDADLQNLTDRLRRALGTKVTLVGSEQQGRIEIAYYSAEELDGLIQRIEGGGAGPAPEPEGTPAAPPHRPRAGSDPIRGLLSSLPRP